MRTCVVGKVEHLREGASEATRLRGKLAMDSSGGQLGSPIHEPSISHPSAHRCVHHRVPFRMSRRGMVRKSRAWVLEKKERHRRQGR